MITEKKRIAIMGCGWLGLPLAKFLIKDGYQINGSTTSEEKIDTLNHHKIDPFIIALSEDSIEGDIEDFLSDSDALIINVPPRLRGKQKENYIKKMRQLHTAVNQCDVKKIIFISSTSVYGSADGIVDEKTKPAPTTESGKQLLASEEIFRNDSSIQTTIVRFGGLIGPDRHPITMLSGRKNLPNGNFPINLIHLKDCINIISEILKNHWWNETLNGVYPYHPTKKEYYTMKAIEKEIPAPEYEMNPYNHGKTIVSYNLTNTKHFKFITTL